MSERSDFWSRRRRSVAREETRAADSDAAAEATAKADALAERDDDEILRMLGLPDPETLTPADAARFMAREIPARLRRRAIRHLFRAHPHLSLPDGLQDYDDDYTDAAVNVRPDAGAWAGLRRSAERVAKKASEAETAPEESEAAASPVPEEVAPIEAVADTEAAPPAIAAAIDEDETDDAPRPRRMTFHFEEEPS